VRRALDQLLAAPGLTRARFGALALVSLLATSTVVAAALRADTTPYDLIAAAQSARAPIVEVAPRAAPRAPAAASPDTAPAPESAPASSAGTGADTGVTQAVASDTGTTTPAPVEAPKTPATPTTPVVPKKPVSKIKHVFVVYLAGAGYDATWGDASAASYLNGTLRPQGTLLQAYHPSKSGDLATLVALTAGQKPTPEIEQGCPTYGSGCVFPIETLSLPDQLISSGLRWRGYAEDLSNGPDAAKSCRHPSLNAADDTSLARPGDEYSTRHNPFVYFRSLTDLGECMTNDLPLDALTEDLKSEQATPNFSFIAPNLCHGGWEATCADGSPGGLAAADAFLAQWVPQILDSPAYKADGLLIVLTGAQPGTEPADANTGALLVSQFAKPGASSGTPYDAFSVLRSVEDLFGLDHLDAAGAEGVGSFARAEIRAGLSSAP
jgi:hypothetical protein